MFVTYNVLLTRFNSFSAANPDSVFAMSNSAANFWAGGLSSEVFWLGSFPFDAVKNRLMSDSITSPKYRTWMDAARSIYNEGGPRAFYRGFTPTLLRAFPTNASAILVWSVAPSSIDEVRLTHPCALQGDRDAVDESRRGHLVEHVCARIAGYQIELQLRPLH